MNIKLAFYSNSIILLLPTILSAQEALPASNPAELPPPTFMSSLAEMGPMFMIVFMVFYFMVLKPQQTKLKDQENLIKNLKKGDMVVTSSGIIGRVAGIEKDHILVELATNVKVKFQTSHVTKLYEAEAAKEVPSKAVAS
jgi:preprotein translocase subunit YajC